MQRHSTVDTRQPEFRILRFPLCIVQCAFCIAALAAVAARAANDLPAGYVEVEYLTSKGTASVFDTGYVFTNRPLVKTTASIHQGADADIAGTAEALPGCFIVDYYYVGDSQERVYYRYSATTSTRLNYSESVRDRWVDYEWGATVKHDGATIGTIASYDFSSNTQTFRLFGGRTDRPSLLCSMKSVEMYDGDALVRRYIPCIESASLRAGLYDAVEGTFHPVDATPSEPVFPAGYVEVEYLTSKGAASVFDTGYVFTNRPLVKTTASIHQGADADIAGTAEALPGCFIVDYYYVGTSQERLYYRYSTTTSTRLNYSGSVLGRWVDYEWGATVKHNGATIGTIASYDFSSNTQTFRLFGGRADRPSLLCSLKSVEMYDGDPLVRWYIPCFETATRRAGMYDVAGRAFYPSDARPSRSVKSVDAPEGIAEARYIESTGSEYIDTGYVFKDAPRVELSYYIVSFGGDAQSALMGTPNAFHVNIGSGGSYSYLNGPSSSEVSIPASLRTGCWHDCSFGTNVVQDGVTLATVPAASFTANTQAFRLFMLDTATATSIARIRSVRIYDGDELVRDLMPCYCGSFGEFGFFDKVGGRFYPSFGLPFKDVPLKSRNTVILLR